MTEADFSGDFLNAENTKDKDLIEITGEGDYTTKEGEKNGKKYKFTKLQIPVKLPNGKMKLYEPDKETGNKFVKLWGTNTNKWVGQKFTVITINSLSYGVTKVMIRGEPLVPEKV